MPFRGALESDIIKGAKLYRGSVTKPPAEDSSPITLTNISRTVAYIGTSGAPGSGAVTTDDVGVMIQFGNANQRMWVKEGSGGHRKTRKTRRYRK